MFQCLDKKRIKMKQGETLALNERIMLSLVSTGTPSPCYLGAKRILHISAGIYILAIPPSQGGGGQFESKLKNREEFEGLEKRKGKGGKRREKGKCDKTHVKIPLWSLNDRKKSKKLGRILEGGGRREFFWPARIYTPVFLLVCLSVFYPSGSLDRRAHLIQICREASVTPLQIICIDV